LQPKIHDDPPIATEIENNVRPEDNINNSEKLESSDYQISPEEPLPPIDALENVDDSIMRKEEVTQRVNVMDAEVNSPTPIGTNEIIKLEKEVDKTIENANNVDDVPFPPKQQDDKILEEFVNSVISNTPNSESTTDSEIFTILTSPTASSEASHTTNSHHQHLSNNHHHRHEIPETVTSEYDEGAVVEEDTHSEVLLPTAGAEEMINESFTMTVAAATTFTTIGHAPEAETIFTPINNDTHNEHINVFIDEKLPIVTTPVAFDLTTISTNIAVEKESMMVSLRYDCAPLLLLPLLSPLNGSLWGPNSIIQSYY
jgi:hypothetical protein